MTSSPDQKKLLAIFTGTPCAGKTTLSEALISATEALGLEPHLINEFDYFWAWVIAQNPNDHTRLIWGEPSVETGRTPLHVTPKGYYLAFEHVNGEVAKEFKVHKKSKLQVVEGARGVGGVPYSHYFGGLDKAIGRQTSFANIEVRVNDTSAQLERAVERSKRYPTAAPVEVVLEYLKEAPMHPKAAEDATLFPRIVINEVIHNNTTPEDAVKAMEGVIGQVVRYFS
jgi:hypothetical protein